jgi:hypothetical protein
LTIGDGPLLEAGIGNPNMLQAGTDGSIYVLDLGCSCVRKIAGAPPVTAPGISADGIVNAASLNGCAIAPGELISIFGSNLGASKLETYTLTNNAIPDVLDDMGVLVNGMPAPVTAASSNQINVFVPYFSPQFNSATIVVNAHGASSPTVTMMVAVSAFGIFTVNGSGSGPGAILNQDGSNTPLRIRRPQAISSRLWNGRWFSDASYSGRGIGDYNTVSTHHCASDSDNRREGCEGGLCRRRAVRNWWRGPN